MACYSFYGNKPLTTGEGGMLCGSLGTPGIIETVDSTMTTGTPYQVLTIECPTCKRQLVWRKSSGLMLLVLRLATLERYSEVCLVRENGYL
jgi:dTDP-4-amino-4,6-dideoxygalactose transaminase